MKKNYCLVIALCFLVFSFAQSNTKPQIGILDDLSIKEKFDKDLMASDGFADYIVDAELKNNIIDATSPTHNFYGGYTTIPEQVVGEFIKFRLAVLNNGIETINNAKAKVTITKNDIEVYSKESSEGIAIGTGARDTLKVWSDFKPTEPGNYKVTLSAIFEDEDENPEDNHWVYEFKVGGNHFSTIKREQSNEFVGAGPCDWEEGGYDGDACVQQFILPDDIEETKILGISFYFDSHRNRTEELEAIENGYFGVYARIWEYNIEDDEVLFTSIASAYKTMQISDTAKWIDIPFINDGALYLEPGKMYFAGIECYTGTTQHYRFQIGKDLSAPKQSAEGGMIFLSSENEWIKSGDNYAIELVLGDEFVGNKSSELIEEIGNITVYPNPFNSQLKIHSQNTINSIVIRNVLGQQLKELYTNSNKFEIPTIELESGIYIITIGDVNNNFTTKRIIKQ